MDPLYYVADAACYCPQHAEEHYPGSTQGEEVRDREGGIVTPVWSHAAPHGVTCDVDDEPLNEPDEQLRLTCPCDYCMQWRENERAAEADLTLVPEHLHLAYTCDWQDAANLDLPLAVLVDGQTVRVGHRQRPEQSVLVLDLDNLRRQGASQEAITALRRRFDLLFPYDD
jgi:hypothetical protein